jgi:hypothetical protein
MDPMMSTCCNFTHKNIFSHFTLAHIFHSHTKGFLKFSFVEYALPLAPKSDLGESEKPRVLKDPSSHP